MNKYQEALIYFCNGCHHEYEEGNYGQCKRVEGRCGHYKSLKEACDKAEKYDEINRVYLKNEVMESADINAERLQQLYEDMQTFIDKATPFIGSIMNKYQEAINELYKQRAERYKVHQKHKDWSKEIKEYDKVGEALETLQELVDQTKTPTLEEVKKEWEELGWYWHYFYNENGIANKYRITKYVPSRKRDGSGDYQLEIYLCNNTKTFNINFNMDMQEYQLLTKTFKALGWL